MSSSSSHSHQVAAKTHRNRDAKHQSKQLSLMKSAIYSDIVGSTLKKSKLISNSVMKDMSSCDPPNLKQKLEESTSHSSQDAPMTESFEHRRVLLFRGG